MRAIYNGNETNMAAQNKLEVVFNANERNETCKNICRGFVKEILHGWSMKRRQSRHSVNTRVDSLGIGVSYRLEYSPHNAVPYSFQCERVLAVIANV